MKRSRSGQSGRRGSWRRMPPKKSAARTSVQLKELDGCPEPAAVVISMMSRRIARARSVNSSREAERSGEGVAAIGWYSRPFGGARGRRDGPEHRPLGYHIAWGGATSGGLRSFPYSSLLIPCSLLVVRASKEQGIRSEE